MAEKTLKEKDEMLYVIERGFGKATKILISLAIITFTGGAVTAIKRDRLYRKK